MFLDHVHIANAKSWFSIWIIAFLMLILGKLYEQYYLEFDHDNGHIIQKQCIEKINKIDLKLKELNSKIANRLQANQSNHDLSFIIDKEIKATPNLNNSYIILCEQNQLTYWNKSNIYFDKNWCPCMDQGIKGIFEHQGNYFYGINQTIDLPEINACFFLYEPILENSNSEEPLLITDEKVAPDQLKISNKSNETLGYLNNAGTELYYIYANILIIIYLLLLFILYYPFYHFTKLFFINNKTQWAYLSLILGIILTLSLSQWIVQKYNFFDSILTKSLITTSFVKYSLFEFIIISYIIFQIVYIFHKYITFEKLPENHSRTLNYIIPILNNGAVILTLVAYCATFKAVFVNSSYFFNLDESIFFKSENYILLICLLLILIALFLISHKLCQSTNSYNHSLKNKMILYLISVVLFFPIVYKFNLDISLFSFFIATSIIIWLQDYFVEYKQNNILWLISWIMIISFLTSGLIFHYQNIKKRTEKEKLVNEINDIKYSNVDTLGISNSIGIYNLINASNKYNYELYIYENEQLKYGTSFNKPDVYRCKEALGKKNQTILQYDGKELLIKAIKPGFTIILSHAIPNLIKAISLFSYLFTMLIIFAYLISLINQNYDILPEGLQVQLVDKPSLRNRIQFYVILGIVISFLTIAIVTVYFTKQSEQKIAEESLFNKLKYLSSFLESTITSSPDVETAFLITENQIKSTSSLFDYNIELYDNKGFQKTIFKNTSTGSDSRIKLCDPEFYFYFPSSLEDIIIRTGDRSNSKLKISAFKNIFLNNQRLATIEMSSFISIEKNKENRLANLINTLLNIYVFLFLIAASLATLLANSITSPLEVLSEKLKQIRIGKRNELLEWSGQDEIGDLIQDYNRMVSQLDESASLLAKSERDSAWKEMAKQVAHEIKNPLTPMKLSIQYLQQYIKSGAQDVSAMVGRVSETLLEQIDGLTKIATEFSNFGTMPKAENEKILINDLISLVHDLFRKRDDIDIYLVVPIDEFYVYCDKNQIIRVLNNIINNAIQAIPEHRRGKIDIELKRKNMFAQICIKDNGIGISSEMKDKVFLPNFTTKNSGTGLGLAMCQQIIESQNGKIYFESNIQMGTQFFIEIPLMRSEEELK